MSEQQQRTGVNGRGRTAAWAAVAAVASMVGIRAASAGLTPTTVVTFNGANGANPTDTLAVGPDGNLYGTTRTDGAAGQGTVFELSGPGFRTLTTLASFSGATGAVPSARLTFDAAGNVYGTTVIGGANNDGTAFELSGATHQTLTTLVSFTGQTGAAVGIAPGGGLSIDAAGNLYGTTQEGGATNAGTVFELSGANHQTFTSLHNFSLNQAQDGAGTSPHAPVIVDAAGNLYGTTQVGGTGGGGGVFELSGSGHASYTALASFNGTNNGGGQPASALVADAAGNLYGTTEGLNGLVYELSGPNHQTLSTVHAFAGTDGAIAAAGLTVDAAGNLYGTTSAGGPTWNPSATSFTPLGTAFELSGADHGTFVTLASFATANAGGYQPYGGLTVLPDGELFGTTTLGGQFGLGTVYTLTAVPEPSTVAALALAAVGGLARGRRRRIASPR